MVLCLLAQQSFVIGGGEQLLFIGNFVDLNHPCAVSVLVDQFRMVEQFFVDCADNAGNRAVYIGNSFYRFNVAESSANLNLVAFLRQVYEYQVASWSCA